MRAVAGETGHFGRLAPKPLPPLVTRREGGRVAWVSASSAEVVAAALLRGDGLAEARPGGRGTVRRFPLENGEGILREYRRGGAARHVLPDGYLLDNRPRRELTLHRDAYAAGLAVPEPLGAAWERRGAFLHGAIATRVVPGQTLLERLAADATGAEALLADCGRLIRAMHDLGIWHADLQGHNLIVGPLGPHLIDFDNARKTGPLGPLPRARNLLRLRRSLAKHGWGAHHFDAMLAGYGAIDVPGWLDTLYSVKDRFSDRWTGRRAP